MTETNIQTEKSLMKCWLKKTVSVSAKVVLFLAYIIDGIAAGVVALYGAFGLATILADPLNSGYRILSSGFQVVVAAICSIPWYVYAGILTVAAIPVYSFIWCIVKELTEEDWNSIESKHIATLISAIIGLCMVTSLLVVVIAGLLSSPCEWLTIAAASFLTPCGVFVLAGMLKDFGIENTKPWLFTGAYLHYRKRTRSNK